MRIERFVSPILTIGAVAALLTSGSLYAGGSLQGGAKVTPLMQKALPDLPGKEGLVLMIEFARACRPAASP